MERFFSQGFLAKFDKLSCVKSQTDLMNFSKIEEGFSKDLSCTVDDPLSQTLPSHRNSAVGEENDKKNYKLIKESVKLNDLILFRKYLNLNMNVRLVNKKRQNFLHIAAKFGCLEICQIILAYTQLGVNSRDEDYRSPLHLAAMNGHSFIVQYLHRCGGYLHIKDRTGRTVIDYALDNKNVELIKFALEKSPGLFKSFGFDLQDLLKKRGISLENSRPPIGDSKNKAKKVADPSDTVYLSDFLFKLQLGKGSFGHVYLVSHIESGKEFAMKMMTKQKIYKDKLGDYIITEKLVLSQMDSPFIVKLYFSFQTSKYLCFVIDYCPNGTLADLLRKKKCLAESKARPFLCEILLAIEALHSKNILYRDLKPENVLIDGTGHIKITDFGLAKLGITEEQAVSFCGTLSYLAPEIIQNKAYGKCADWYAFGVLMFKILTGKLPDLKKTGLTEFRIPGFISNSAKHLIQGLLCKDYRSRLGSEGAGQIKSHEFFSGVDWEAAERKELVLDFQKIEKETGQEFELPEGVDLSDLENF